MTFYFNAILNKTSLKKQFRYKMKEIINKFLLAGDKLMPEMHLKQLGFTLVLLDLLLKTKKKFKNSKKQEILAIFIKMNLTKFVFSMIWLMEILKILHKDRF